MANPSPNPNPNPRRNSYSNTVNSDNSSRLMNFFKRPHAFPFLLSVFLLLTWLSFRLQHSSHFSPSSRELHKAKEKLSSKDDDDRKANLVRFKSDLPSLILKDKRGWLLNPVSLALNSGVKGLPFLFPFMCSTVYVNVEFSNSSCYLRGLFCLLI